MEVPMSGDNPPTDTGTERRKRRPHRRDQILAAAIELFHRKGYSGAGMDEIGAAAGISGPGIYRHFESKEDILEQAIRGSVAESLDRARTIAAEANSPGEAIRSLISNTVDPLLSDRAMAGVIMRERRFLSDASRRWLRSAEQTNAEYWVAALGRLRPELNHNDIRLMVQAALWLCMSVAYNDSYVSPDREAEILKAMVLTSLACDVPETQ
jgi:AcrR family transcriptional regulator